MKFDMRKPCNECPFICGSSTNRTLREGRLEEIVDGLRSDATFTCHKSLSLPSSEQQHCAGALIFSEREGNVGQMVRFAERLGLYDQTKLDMDFEGLISNDDY